MLEGGGKLGFLFWFFLDLRYQKTGQRLLASKEEKQFSCGKEERRTIVYYSTKRILSENEKSSVRSLNDESEIYSGHHGNGKMDKSSLKPIFC